MYIPDLCKKRITSRNPLKGKTETTSFPGSLILPPFLACSRERCEMSDPGSEVKIASRASMYVPDVCQTSFRWYILEVYRVGGGDRIPVRRNNGHARCPSVTAAGIEISVVCKVEEGSVIVDLPPETFTERRVSHIIDNLKTTKQKNQRMKTLEEREFERNY